MCALQAKMEVTVGEFTEEEQRAVEQHYSEESVVRDLVHTVPSTITLTRTIATHLHLVRGIRVRQDDVWVVTPPKCGTTWLQDLTWLTLNNADIEKVSVPLFDRSPWPELPLLMNLDEAVIAKYFAELEARPSPRVIKSHLPLELLPPSLATTGKVIFVCRNARDQAVSFYHHEKLLTHHGLLTSQGSWTSIDGIWYFLFKQ